MAAVVGYGLDEHRNGGGVSNQDRHIRDAGDAQIPRRRQLQRAGAVVLRDVPAVACYLG